MKVLRPKSWTLNLSSLFLLSSHSPPPYMTSASHVSTAMPAPSTSALNHSYSVPPDPSSSCACDFNSFLTGFTMSSHIYAAFILCTAARLRFRVETRLFLGLKPSGVKHVSHGIYPVYATQPLSSLMAAASWQPPPPQHSATPPCLPSSSSSPSRSSLMNSELTCPSSFLTTDHLGLISN